MKVEVYRPNDEPVTLDLDLAVRLGDLSADEARQVRDVADDPRPDWQLKELGMLPRQVGRLAE